MLDKKGRRMLIGQEFIRNFTFTGVLIVKKISSMVLSAALVAAQFGVMSAPSSAAGNAGCACQSTASAATVGKISSVSGDVMIAGKNGFEVAKAGSVLSRNGQVITGTNGKVAGTMGGCKFAVSANSTMSVVDKGSNVCLKVSGVNIAPAMGEEGGSLVPLAIGVVVIGGAIGLAVGLSNDKKVSP